VDDPTSFLIALIARATMVAALPSFARERTIAIYSFLAATFTAPLCPIVGGSMVDRQKG